MNTQHRRSPCKVNLLLNVLGKRPDGFHELETILQPIDWCDELTIRPSAQPGIHLSCDNPSLPLDSGNLVYRAAEAFFTATGIRQGVELHLEKQVPWAAGLGGGSGNAAQTLLGLNRMFDGPLTDLTPLAARLGADVPFFLSDQPAMATGRGEQILPLKPFSALHGTWILVVFPGFGVSTPWAYKQLAQHPEILNGIPGRARDLVEQLQRPDLAGMGGSLFNALEVPVLRKFPLLKLYQDFFRANDALGTLMSGSGSSTFALFTDQHRAEKVREKLFEQFGDQCLVHLSPILGSGPNR